MRNQDGTIRLQVTTALACSLVLVFAIAGGSFFFTMELTHTIEEAIEESTMESQPLLELIQAVQESYLEGHDYLIYGTKNELAEYKSTAKRTDIAFESAMNAPFEDEKEKELVRHAFIKWKVANNLTLSHVPGEDPGIKLMHMRKIDNQLNEIQTSLNWAFERTQEEMDEIKAGALALKRMSTIFIFTLSVLAVISIVLLWRWLVHSITGPLKELANNVNAVGTGEVVLETNVVGDDELGRLVRAVNDMSARVSENTTSLKELAGHDELTGLYNNRALMGLLEDEIARSSRYGHAFSFILLDIDHFKDINDTYGHAAGDDVICQLATLITESIRDVDKVARYGGDEIAIILPETDGTKALAMAERIRLGVSSQHVMLPGGEMLRIEISIGMAEYPGKKESIRDLISAADNALYEAKRKGRNRVCTESGYPDANQ